MAKKPIDFGYKVLSLEFLTLQAERFPEKDPVKGFVEAKFPGGQLALQKYFEQHLKYPECAEKMQLVGKVKVAFYVLPDGSIRGAKVVKGIHKCCDRVALEAIQNMPKWQPAKKSDIPIGSKKEMVLDFYLGF